MTSYAPESILPGKLDPVEIGIFDEADPLQTAAIWGPVGAEAVLAQCYPLEISLFYQSFNVVAARQESLGYATALQEHGVRVLMIRDLLAEAIQPHSLIKDQVVSDMIRKARTTQDLHGTSVPEDGDLIAELVEQDINRYGEEAALILNQTLSILPNLPLGNCIYARDQMNELLETRVRS